MGHHIDSKGRFQSDKYPDLPPDKIILSFKDPHAQLALIDLAKKYWEDDAEFSKDIMQRLITIKNP